MLMTRFWISGSGYFGLIINRTCEESNMSIVVILLARSVLDNHRNVIKGGTYCCI